MATDQKEQQVIEKIDKRELKGRVIASSRQVYRIVNSDVFYVESETQADLYYYVMFDTSEADGCEWCSCPSFTYHSTRCKHLIAVSYAIRWGTFTDTDKLPPLAKKDNNNYKKESIRTLNDLEKAEIEAEEASKSKSYLEDEYDF